MLRKAMYSKIYVYTLPLQPAKLAWKLLLNLVLTFLGNDWTTLTSRRKIFEL